ncbi:hypothetical protein ZWY2020_053536 [Hordeum vulgare]|nr:hypothetical protein ZWY2020_053536 [Hordeum vulgare]
MTKARAPPDPDPDRGQGPAAADAGGPLTAPPPIARDPAEFAARRLSRHQDPHWTITNPAGKAARPAEPSRRHHGRRPTSPAVLPSPWPSPNASPASSPSRPVGASAKSPPPPAAARALPGSDARRRRGRGGGGGARGRSGRSPWRAKRASLSNFDAIFPPLTVSCYLVFTGFEVE